MFESRELSDIPFGLGLSFVASVAAFLVTVLPVRPLVSVVVGVPFLLFVPGYAVTVALFPRTLPWNGPVDIRGSEGLFPFDRLVLSIALSIALAIIVGVNLEFTPLEIRASTVVGFLVIITLIAASIGVVRRADMDRRRSDMWSVSGARAFGRSMFATHSDSMATVMVILAVSVSLVSVAVVAGTGERGEQYTEFGLLTEDENGDLVAEDHPSNMTVGEETPLYYTVTNREQRDQTYFIVVQLQEVTDNGTVTRAERVNGFQSPVSAGETVQRGHTITPTFAGDELRLQYLLYRGQPPAEPSEANAYRHLHIWVDVSL